MIRDVDVKIQVRLYLNFDVDVLKMPFSYGSSQMGFTQNVDLIMQVQNAHMYILYRCQLAGNWERLVTDKPKFHIPIERMFKAKDAINKRRNCRWDQSC